LVAGEGRRCSAASSGDEPAFAGGWNGELAGLAGEYRQDRAALDAKAGLVAARLREAQSAAAGARALGPEVVSRALGGLREAFDAGHGGFGVPPRRPPPGAVPFPFAEHGGR